MKNLSLNGFPWPWPEGLAYTSENLFAQVFYAAYPRKEKRKRALAVFQTLGPGVDLLREMLAWLEQDKRDWDASGLTPPLPDNWLKAQGWKYDKPLPPEAKAGGLIVSDALEPELHEV